MPERPEPEMDGWWLDAKFPPMSLEGADIDEATCTAALYRRALAGRGGPVVRVHANGNLAGTFDPLLQELRAAGGRVVSRRIMVLNSGASEWLLTWPHGLCRVSHFDGGGVTLSCVTGDGEFAERLAAIAQKHIKRRAPSGRIYVLANDQRGRPELKALGAGGVPLERENYEPGVVEAFDHVVRDLVSPAPCGRLVLIDGPPGTGKSFVVRALLAERGTEATFVLVPPDLVGAMSGPELVPVLLEHRGDQDFTDAEEDPPGPIVLVLEDADECLAPRMADNIRSVASMLAFGDGLLGSIMDVRLVATTNRARVELDEALLRPGRLCRRIPVGPLPPSRARAIFRKLLGNDPGGSEAGAFERPMALAEVYAAARRAGWSPLGGAERKGPP